MLKTIKDRISPKPAQTAEHTSMPEAMRLAVYINADSPAFAGPNGQYHSYAEACEISRILSELASDVLASDIGVGSDYKLFDRDGREAGFMVVNVLDE